MRLNSSYDLAVVAVAALLLAGCTEAPEPLIADSTNTSFTQTASPPPASSDSDRDRAESKSAQGARKSSLTNPSSSGVENATRNERPDQPIVPNSDSDKPGSYQSKARNTSGTPPHEHVHAVDGAVVDEGKPKANGRRPDGDDPAAPLIIPQVTEQQDDAPLNNGRDPAAKPIPEGQRIVIETKDVPVELLNVGRDKDAKPGAKLTTPPAEATSPKKPASPKPATLSDLSESIQALDKDRDGQLGLYEWPREKLAEFKTLDSNSDGFLTPAELVAGQEKASKAATPSTDAEKNNDDNTADDKQEATGASDKDASAKDASAKDNSADKKDSASVDVQQPKPVTTPDATDAAKPDGAKPDGAKPDAAKPEAPKADSVKPAKKDTATADTAEE